MKKEYVKVTISVNADLLKRVEEYADSLSINRSSAMSVLMSQALEYKEAMGFIGVLPGLLEKMETIQKEKTERPLLT